MRSLLTAALAVLAVTMIPAAAAAAAVPCSPTLSDPEKDMEFTNRDIVAAFVRGDGGVVTAHQVLKEITFAPPSPTALAGSATPGTSRHEWNEGDSMIYRTVYSVAGKRWYAQAEVIAGKTRSTVDYSYGSVSGASVTRLGATTGTVGTGKNAVVSVVLPESTGAKVGAPLERFIAVDQNVGNLPGGLKNEEGGDVLPGGTHDGPMPTEMPGAADVAVLDCARAGTGGANAIAAKPAATSVLAGDSTRVVARVAGATAGAKAQLVAVGAKGRVTLVQEKEVLGDGRVIFRVKPARTTTFQVVSGAVSSLPFTVAISPAVRVRITRSSTAGFVFTGSLRPADRAVVVVQRRLEGRWFDEARGVARRGRFRIVARFAERGGTYRVKVRASRVHGVGFSSARRAR